MANFGGYFLMFSIVIFGKCKHFLFSSLQENVLFWSKFRQCAGFYIYNFQMLAATL